MGKAVRPAFADEGLDDRGLRIDIELDGGSEMVDPAGGDVDDLDQALRRMVAAEMQLSRGYFESVAEIAQGSYDVPGGAAFHQRLSLAWQPLSDWTLQLTDGALRMVTPPAEGLRVQRFQGVELQTTQSAGIVKVEAKLASQLVNEVTQPQVLHAASVTLSAPIDDHWTVGGDSLITSQGNLMRFKLSGTMANDKAKLSLVVPKRSQGRTVDPALNGSLPLVDAADSLGWRTQLEVRF